MKENPEQDSDQRLQDDIAKADIRCAVSEALALIKAGRRDDAINRLVKTVDLWIERLG